MKTPVSNKEAVQWALQHGLASVRPPPDVSPEAIKRRYDRLRPVKGRRYIHVLTREENNP